MAGRRLTISSLLCADDQSGDRSQSSATQPNPSPRIPSSLSGPGVPPVEYREPPASTSGISEPHSSPYDRRAYLDYNRDGDDALVPQPLHTRKYTPPPPAVDPLAYPSVRRVYRDGIIARSEPLTSHAMPTASPVSREFEPTPHHLSHHLPQASPRPNPSSRRSSDPNRPEHHVYEDPLNFSPPTSYGVQSEYFPNPSAYPQPPHSHPHPHSIAQQSPSQYSRRPSHSPVLGLHHISTSPTNTIRQMSQSSSLANQQGSPFALRSPSLSQSPSGTSNLASPGQRTLMSRSSHYHAGQFSEPDAPHTYPRSSSVASLLNAEPSRSPVASMGARGSPGGFGGLEALVEAATSERRRLSGERKGS